MVTEYVLAAIIVLVLLGLAGYFGWRQGRVLRRLPPEGSLPAEDRRYMHRQAWRRLVCCGLMVLLAGLIAGWYFFGLHRHAAELLEQGQQGGALNAEQERLLHFSMIYVGLAFLVLLGMLGLAAVDVWAIRRFGIRHYRQIQADRREMLERQAARLRTQRNGHG